MNHLTKDNQELYTLLGKLLDDAITEPQQHRLNQLLQENPNLIACYVRFFRLSAELHSCLSRPEVSFSSPDLNLNIPAPPPCDHQTGRSKGNLANDQERIRHIRQRAEQQLQAFLAEQEGQRKDTTIPSRPLNWDIGHLFQKAGTMMSLVGRSVVRIAACVALLVLAVGFLHGIRARRVVATLSQSSHAIWEAPMKSSELPRGNWVLRQGYAELTFAHGARVLVQAPCSLTLLSPDRMAVEHGRVTARVPPEAVGFTIDTPASSIKDFGTEFGVGIDDRTQTEVHVYQGRVQLRMPHPSPTHQNQWDLTKDHAAILDTLGNLEVTGLRERPNLFVRHLPTDETAIPGQSLNLADIIGCGSGLGTGLPYHGLHLATGEFVDSEENVGSRAIGFVPTQMHDFIDGVFVPDSDDGSPLAVTSTGLTYDRCPDTSGLCVHMIRNGALFRHEEQPPEPGQLRGEVYGLNGKPAISMHANAGLTFDLDRIRAVYPGARIARFTSLAGISETVKAFTDGMWKGQPITVGFRVLIDGRERFSRDLTAVPSQTAEINLPLRDTERFLTLITLEGHPDRPFAWSLFGEPRLEFTPRIQ